MFKIRNSKKVTLDDNVTSSEQFLDGENIDEVKARRNRAGVGEPHGFWSHYWAHVLAGITILTAVGIVVYKWPALKPFLTGG